jgi:hypothetical protein
LLNLIGDENRFVVEFIKDKNKLVIHTDRIFDDMNESVSSLLEGILPQNIKVVRYNHDISIPWQEIPEGFTVVDYLESTGTQCLFKAYQAVEYSTLKGEWVSQYTSLEERHFFGYTGTAFHGINWGGNWNFGLGVADLKKHLFWMELSKSNGLSARIDNGRIATQSFSTAQAAFCPFSIAGGFAASLKCYSAKHWIDNSPVHDFVPCLDPTGAPCMFDLVSKKAFYNKGSGDFLYPTDAAPAAAIGMDDKFYAQLTEHGVRRLYKVPDGCNMTKDEYAAANGFKELVEPPLPQTRNWTPHWYETDTQVILEWKETEEPYTEDFNLEQPTEN